MSETIKAIETEYNGYRFRSRLEARWAVFFDAIGLEYQYEPEGFYGFAYNGEDEKDYMYLPDFYFPKFELYAEVKGTTDQLFKDSEKIGRCIDFNSTPISKGLILLGDIPNYENISWGNIPVFQMLKCNKGVVIDYATFMLNRWYAEIVVGEGNVIRSIYTFGVSRFNGAETSIPSNSSVHCIWSKTDLLSEEYYESTLCEAYKKARQARFEHGEKPEFGKDRKVVEL